MKTASVRSIPSRRRLILGRGCAWVAALVLVSAAASACPVYPDYSWVVEAPAGAFLGVEQYFGNHTIVYLGDWQIHVQVPAIALLAPCVGTALTVGIGAMFAMPRVAGSEGAAL